MGNVGGIIMKFAIAKTDYWKLKGFDVTEWRKSKDGELALVHDDFARMLLPDIDKYNNVKIRIKVLDLLHIKQNLIFLRTHSFS